MNTKTERKLIGLSKTINNSKDKIEKYQKKLRTETDYTEKQKLELKIEIEKIRVVMKKKEGKLIILSNK